MIKFKYTQGLEMMLHHLTKISFLGNWSHAVVHRLTTACDQNVGWTFTKVNFKKAARPLTKLFFFQNIGLTFIKANFKKVARPLLKLIFEKRPDAGFSFIIGGLEGGF